MREDYPVGLLESAISNHVCPWLPWGLPMTVVLGGSALLVIALAIYWATADDPRPGVMVGFASVFTALWAAFLSFRALFPVPRFDPNLQLKGSGPETRVILQLENKSKRSLKLFVDFDLWIDDQRIDLGSLYDGSRGVPLGPQRNAEFSEVISPLLNGKAERGQARVGVRWRDYFCSSDKSPPKYWIFSLPGGPVNELIDRQDILRHFGTNS